MPIQKSYSIKKIHKPLNTQNNIYDIFIIQKIKLHYKNISFYVLYFNKDDEKASVFINLEELEKCVYENNWDLQICDWYPLKKNSNGYYGLLTNYINGNTPKTLKEKYENNIINKEVNRINKELNIGITKDIFKELITINKEVQKENIEEFNNKHTYKSTSPDPATLDTFDILQEEDCIEIISTK